VNTSKSPSRHQRTEISALLDTEQVFNLDEIAAVIRHDTGKQLTRSAIIRAILSSSLPYKQNWLKCRSEEHRLHAMDQA